MFPMLKTLEMSFASCGWLDSQLNLSQKHFKDPFGGILLYLSKGQLLANLTWVNVAGNFRYRDNSHVYLQSLKQPKENAEAV